MCVCVPILYIKLASSKEKSKLIMIMILYNLEKLTEVYSSLKWKIRPSMDVNADSKIPKY